jgi:hypothetical protein
MMLDDAEESQLKGPIDVLAPYSSRRSRGCWLTSASLGHDGFGAAA